MNHVTCTVIDITMSVSLLGRAGQKAGKTNTAKLAGVTRERAHRKLLEAIDLGLIYAYKNTYRPHVKRICYGITETGISVLDAIDFHRKGLSWPFDDKRDPECEIEVKA